MHIAIDGRPLEGGHSSRGTGVYTRNLIDALRAYAPEHTYTIVSTPHALPKQVDLLHIPFFDPFFLTLPMKKPVPTVVTVHDLIPLVYPSHFRPGLRGAFKWRAQKWALRNTTAIVTDSEASKKDIVRLVGMPASRVHVVPLAPDPRFSKKTTKEDIKKVRSTYKLPQRYLLYVGDVNWNKNVPGLLQAVAQLNDIPLVLVGRAFQRPTVELAHIDQMIEKLGISSRIIKTGYVDDHDLVALYAGATVSITPSFAEGFGFPVLEAMMCGTPTVVATGSSLDEIAGPSVRVNPQDPADIASGITKALGVDRAAWQKKATTWVSKFSWQTVARSMSTLYETVAR